MGPGDSQSSPAATPFPDDDWDGLLERNLPAVQTFARMNLDPQLRSREAVSDIVQSTFGEVLAARERIRFESDEAFRAYLHTCVTRKILDKKRYWNRGRRESRRVYSLETEGLHLSGILRSPSANSPSAIFVRGEQIQRLQDAFDQLGEREKQLFSMRFIFGLQATHIGSELGTPESSVRKELARLQLTLIEILGPLD
ncbi:MAG: sigma-70 family RNA polymerase sigma factor [Planctomycetes bacterium]|nr:sigma-70 family RNA polymerase sigma factor [Planctomycetota bacterium]